jgi:DNA-directed RNA polymerase specialized sigma24 family protein
MIDLDTFLPSIAAGDVHSFGKFCAGSELALRESLRSFATRVDIEAIVQETFLRIWQLAPSFTPDGRPNALFRMAVRIARNLAISETRRIGKREERDESVLEVSVEVTEVDPFLRQHVFDCYEKLPEKPAAALRARLDGEGVDADAMLASRLSMKLNTFLQNVTRAKKLLADCLEKQGVALPGAS